jgi:hypothetical protein
VNDVKKYIVEDKFIEFCIKNNVDPCEVIISNNLQAFFYDKIKSNKSILAIGILRLKLQESLNNILFEELVYIDKKMHDSNIKYILLKGLPLGAELYSPPEIRTTTDIDIFVPPNKMSDALNVIGSLGYLDYTGQIASGSNLEHDPSFDYGNHHMMPFKRKYKDSSTDEEGLFVIELHRSPYPRTKYDFGEIDYSMIDLEGLINTSEKVLLNGLHFCILSINNRLLHLLLHLTTHFFNDCRDYIYLNKRPYIQLRLAIDIAKFIEINQTNIDWENIREKAQKWGFYEDVCFGAYVINTIFGAIVPVYSENNFSLFQHYSEKVDFMRRAIPFLTKLNIKKLIFGDGYKDIYNIIRQNTQFRNTYFCFHRMSSEADVYNVPLIINENKIKDNTGNISFFWDESGFYIQASIFHYNSILQANHDTIITNDHIPGLFIFFYYTGNITVEDVLCQGYCLRVDRDDIQLIDVQGRLTDINKRIVPSNKYSCTCERIGETLIIKATLSWDLLKTKFRAEDSCGISSVYSNKMNMFEYCTPDQHNALVFRK